MVKRYSPEADYMAEDSLGGWVEFEDYQAVKSAYEDEHADRIQLQEIILKAVNYDAVNAQIEYATKNRKDITALTKTVSDDVLTFQKLEEDLRILSAQVAYLIDAIRTAADFEQMQRLCQTYRP